MLDMTPRAKVPTHRFPPLPFLNRRPKVTAADRRVIRMALRAGDHKLPTDWPDLETLLGLLDEEDRPLPEGLGAASAAVVAARRARQGAPAGLRGRRARESAA